MAHARIALTYALDLITRSIELDEPSPTDGQIADYCGLHDPTHVRSLLADLADAGKITIRGTGADRKILLGRQTAPLTTTPRPTPSVKSAAGSKRRLTLDETADRIKEILARGKAPAAPLVKTPDISAPVAQCRYAPDKPVSPQALPLPGASDEGAQARGSHRDEPAPQPIHVKQPRRPNAVRAMDVPDTVATRAERFGKHCMTVSLPTADYWKLVELANAGGKMPGSLARDLVLAALNGELNPERFAPPAKVRVPAHITAAAVREGVPVVAFVAELLERGFDAWSSQWSLERCA